MTIVDQDMTPQQSVALWGKLRQHFINAAEVLEEIITRRAWEPMGYQSFTEAWHAQMEGVTLASEVRPHVVYQMLTEGYDYDVIAAAVKGDWARSSRVVRSAAPQRCSRPRCVSVRGTSASA